MNFGHGLLLVIKLGDAPGFRGGNLDHGLVGHNIHNRLVFLDFVTFGNAPFHHLALNDAFADIRQDKVFGGVIVRFGAGGRLFFRLGSRLCFGRFRRTGR